MATREGWQERLSLTYTEPLTLTSFQHADIMLEHLIGPGLDPTVCETAPTSLVGVGQAAPSQILAAQQTTSDWLDSMGLSAMKVAPAASVQVARDAFNAIAAGVSEDEQRHRLLEIKVPEELRHTMAMLTAYDWAFVEQAKQLRSFVVSRLVEEAENAAKSSDRTKALIALGKVTEVGLFTEKVEVKKTEQTDEELDKRIKERLNKLQGIVTALPKPATTLPLPAMPGTASRWPSPPSGEVVDA